jgi:hypothetical protein
LIKIKEKQTRKKGDKSKQTKNDMNKSGLTARFVSMFFFRLDMIGFSPLELGNEENFLTPFICFL